MEEKQGQSPAVLFQCEKLILAGEETTSAGGCGVSLAAFSRPAASCHSDRMPQGVFLSEVDLVSLYTGRDPEAGNPMPPEAGFFTVTRLDAMDYDNLIIKKITITE